MVVCSIMFCSNLFHTHTVYTLCLVCARDLETSPIKTRLIGQELPFGFAILCSFLSQYNLKKYFKISVFQEASLNANRLFSRGIAWRVGYFGVSFRLATCTSCVPIFIVFLFFGQNGRK